MDNVNRGMNPTIHNPLSAQYIDAATRNVSQQMGVLKKQDEIDSEHSMSSKGIEDLYLHGKDDVEIDEQMEAASRTGLLSELEKGKKKDKSENLRETANEGFGAREATGQEKNQTALKSEMEKTLGKLEKLSVSKEKIDNIRKDIPPEKFEAAKKIVSQQIDTEKMEPSESLKMMKPVPEAAEINTKPAEYHPIIGIHDTMNLPMSTNIE